MCMSGSILGPGVFSLLEPRLLLAVTLLRAEPAVCLSPRLRGVGMKRVCVGTGAGVCEWVCVWVCVCTWYAFVCGCSTSSSRSRSRSAFPVSQCLPRARPRARHSLGRVVGASWDPPTRKPTPTSSPRCWVFRMRVCVCSVPEGVSVMEPCPASALYPRPASPVDSPAFRARLSAVTLLRPEPGSLPLFVTEVSGCFVLVCGGWWECVCVFVCVSCVCVRSPEVPVSVPAPTPCPTPLRVPRHQLVVRCPVPGARCGSIAHLL